MFVAIELKPNKREMDKRLGNSDNATY